MKKTLLFLHIITAFALADKSCRDCHKDFEPSCDLACSDCHISPNADFIPSTEEEHPIIIRNPSTERWWEEKCISCHEKEINIFKNSLHYSYSGIISQIRYLWGKDQKLNINLEEDEWKVFENINFATGHTPAQLVDNLLAKKCFACHFNALGKKNAIGRKRPSGCAACHIPLDQQSGKPLNGHRMRKKVKDSVCLTCHSGNYIGADYHGYFEHDYHQEYATPYGSKPSFGAYQHRLAKDVHQLAGMQCMDCHTRDNIMGDRTTRRFEGQIAGIQCESCHGGFNYQANKSKSKSIKLFNPETISHKNFHENVTCSACHAQWSYQDYGLHLFLDETNNYQMWSDYKWQSDNEVTILLQNMVNLPPAILLLPLSSNKLSGQSSIGIWYKGWTFRRWDDPVLGINSEGKYVIIRPLYQYHITYVDSNETVWLDSEIPQSAAGKGWSWDAYVPHTTGKSGRTCESCHENPKAAGLGIRQNRADSVSHPITIPSEPIILGSRLLNNKERKSLLDKSNNYKIWRARAYRKTGIEEFFKNE